MATVQLRDAFATVSSEDATSSRNEEGPNMTTEYSQSVVKTMTRKGQ